jgi:hypothetical protein
MTRTHLIAVAGGAFVLRALLRSPVSVLRDL